MPIYIFSHPTTKEIREIVQSIHEDHVFIDEDGIKWDREFTVPNAAIDLVNIDPFSAADFNKKTNAKGTVGDVLDRSREFSEMRKNKLGTDPIQEKHYESYAKERNGKQHNDVRKRKLKEKLGKSKWFEAS